MKLNDEQLAAKEALLFKQAGGRTIVDVTNVGLCRDPLGLARISRATGLNIIMGSGYYIDAALPVAFSEKTVEEIAEEIVRDIMVGVGDTGVCAGIIGEIGCSMPLTDLERKSLMAAAQAQRKTGAAINVHPSPSDELALEIIEILRQAGADLNHTVFSHCDCWNFARDTLRQIAEAGIYIEFDTFGCSFFPPFQGVHLDIPSDMNRINTVLELITEGYVSRILLSHDVFFKHCLTAYGGYGYAHILRDILPIIRSKGVSENHIHTLLTENPNRLLTFAPIENQ
jgi:phosphotriesterase-related protein